MPGGQGGQGQPAPFLRKTYDLVSDESTDEIISWGPHGTSFIVWQPVEFSRRLLPTQFKHDNFSSFVRQLNTYGFRKVADNWEFVNEGFLKHDPGALSRITRRKPSSRPAEAAGPLTLSGDESPALAHGPTPGSVATALAFESRGTSATGAAALSRGSAFVRSLPQELPAREAQAERGASLPPPAKGWDAGGLALGGLQRFGRLVDSVLKADREGLVRGGSGCQPPLTLGSGAFSSTAALAGPDSATSSGTISGGGGGGKRKRGADAEAGHADGGEAAAVTRPRAGHLEGMTQSLLSDVAGQGRRLHELAAEVAALRSQAAPPSAKRRGKAPSGGDWQAFLEEQMRSTEQLADQFADQVAVNDELWASQAALEARLAALEAGGSAALEQRLAVQERRGAATAQENSELRARVQQLEAALAAERVTTDARVWRAMLQAAGSSGGATLADTLRQLLDAAAARAAAAADSAASEPAAADATPPAQQGVRQPPGQASGEPATAAGTDARAGNRPAGRPADGPAAAANRAAAAACRTAALFAATADDAAPPASSPAATAAAAGRSGAAGSGAVPGSAAAVDRAAAADRAAAGAAAAGAGAAPAARQRGAQPGSMAALGFTCTPETCGPLFYTRGPGRGRKRPSHADRASGRYDKLPPPAAAAPAACARSQAQGAAPQQGGRAPSGGLPQAGGLVEGGPVAALPKPGQPLAPQLSRQSGGAAQAGSLAVTPKREPREPPEPQLQGQALASSAAGGGAAQSQQSAAC